VREECGKKSTSEKETLPTVLKNLKNVPKEVMSYLLMEKA
jgi:hypothetical protein